MIIENEWTYCRSNIHGVWKFLLQTSRACREDRVNNFLNRNPCPEMYRFRAAGTCSKYAFKYLASAGDKVIVIKWFMTPLVAMAWSVVALPSNLVARVRFPAGSGILILILGLGVCPLCSVLCCLGGGPDIVLTTHSGRPALVYLPSVLVQRLLLPLQASYPRAFEL